MPGPPDPQGSADRAISFTLPRNARPAEIVSLDFDQLLSARGSLQSGAREAVRNAVA